MRAKIFRKFQPKSKSKSHTTRRQDDKPKAAPKVAFISFLKPSLLRCCSLDLSLSKMDLGFGNANQVMGDAATKMILQSAKAQEENIQENMARYDALLEANDDTLEALRERRLAQLKAAQKKKQQWRDAGHGEYSNLEGQDGDVARAFFEATKASERVVVHFYRPTTRFCDVFHSHLEKLAPRHLETRFLKINVEGCDQQGGGASFLVEKLGIVVMPTLLIIKNRKAVHQIQGFDELGGTEDFSTDALAFVIGNYEGLTRREEEETMPEELKENSQILNSIRIRKGMEKGVRDGLHNEDFDE